MLDRFMCPQRRKRINAVHIQNLPTTSRRGDDTGAVSDVVMEEVLDVGESDAAELLAVAVANVMIAGEAPEVGTTGEPVAINNDVTVSSDHVEGMTMLVPDTIIEAAIVDMVALDEIALIDVGTTVLFEFNNGARTH